MSDPRAFRWLDQVLSEQGPPDPITRLVLCGVFKRIDWDSGRNFFEGSRSLSKRLKLNKDTITKHLEIATNQGFLTRIKRSVTDSKGNERSGYRYDLAFPLSDHAGQQDKSCCPVPQGLLSDQTDAAVRPARTYSPLNHHDSKKAQKAPRSGSMRSKLISAAKRSYERESFEKEYPEALSHLRRVGGWQRLGQSNAERELPRLITEIIEGVRHAA